VTPFALALALAMAVPQEEGEAKPARARDLGIRIGELPPGPLNAITDVEGVAVGHCTVVEGDEVRTGVTLVVPRLGENTFRRKLPAAVFTGNGFGKAAGFTQVEELGEIEAPIALTNTLSVGTVLEAMARLVLEQPGNEEVRSVNVVVGETNDGWLSDIRGQHVRAEHVLEAWQAAARGPVELGSVGAGAGTVCMGFKGGIGSASRVVTAGPWTVGVLVQTNFGGSLRIDGRPFPPRGDPREDRDGSCMVVVATDAPVDARNLGRMAKRTMLGLARVGSVMANGSGDYAIAFSTANPIEAGEGALRTVRVLRNDAMTPLFQAVVEATEEAVLDSLFAARTTRGRAGHVAHAIDLEAVRRVAGER
jgi:D-aminopeptidase